MGVARAKKQERGQRLTTGEAGGGGRATVLYRTVQAGLSTKMAFDRHRQ